MFRLKKRIKKNTGLILAGIFTAIISVFLTQNYLFTIKPLNDLELKFLDERFDERSNVILHDSSQIVIVDINQDCYDQIPSPYNRWPWPRSIFAHVIKNLNAAGAKAVGIDIVMSDPDGFSIKNDELLKSVIRKYKNVVVAGKLDVEQENVLDRLVNVKITSTKKMPLVVKQKAKENYYNIFFGADSSVGLVQVSYDDDGVARRYYPYAKSLVTKKRVPSFGFAILNKYYGLPNDYSAKSKGGNFIFGSKIIPKFDNFSYLINYYGSNLQSKFKRVSLIDVLNDKSFKTTDELDVGEDINTWDDPDFGLLYSGIFKDKIVLIGSTMPEDQDLIPVSVSQGGHKGSNQIYGVYFHANAIQNVIGNDFLYKESKFYAVTSVVLLSLFIFFISSFLRQIKSKFNYLFEILNVIIVATGIYLVYLFNLYLFTNNNLVAEIVSPSVAIALGYLGSTAYNFLNERKKNVVIKGMFSQYVSSALVNQLIENPDRLKLGGEKKSLTILFSDIIGFTSFSEKKSPEELVKFMNEYLNAMTEIVLKNNGTLDKYIGDAIMAFWGAPIPLADHAIKACSTAMEMRKALNILREQYSSNPNDQIDIRIGIHTGEVVVGNMGSHKRFDYTVMGDNVNLASRLEGASKQYGTRVIVSEKTYNLIKDKFIVRLLDTVRVKGKSKPTKIFELLGFKDDTEAVEKIGRLKLYLLGLEEYKVKKFNEAYQYFDKSIQKNPDDKPSWTYLERCQFYMETPPDKNWDGVFELKTK